LRQRLRRLRRRAELCRSVRRLHLVRSGPVVLRCDGCLLCPGWRRLQLGLLRPVRCG
jgi:hypothetical protein